jgi:pantoate--beta-alanine ligase
MRLNADERKSAAAIYKALTYIKENIKNGDPFNITNHAKKILAENDFTIDYVEIADAETLDIIHQRNGEQRIVALIAAFQHETRLIDNMVIANKH